MKHPEKWVPVLLRGYNGYDVKSASDEAGTVVEGPSLTQQHFAEECDINVIVARFGLLGELPSGVRAPMYGDFTGIDDYQSALNQIMAAEESFMQMRPEVRARFDNNPALFVDFCSDPRNIDAMREMGLAVPKEKDREPVSVRVVGEDVGGKVGASGAGDRGDAVAAGGGKVGVAAGREGGR